MNNFDAIDLIVCSYPVTNIRSVLFHIFFQKSRYFNVPT